MNFSPRHHPQVLTALEIVRDRPASYRSFIRSIAMFTVTTCNEYGARFAIEHYAFDRETKRSDSHPDLRLPACARRQTDRHIRGAGNGYPRAVTRGSGAWLASTSPDD